MVNVIDPTRPRPTTALPPDARLRVYEKLLAEAEERGDRGASRQMTADILNAVDMGAADRAAEMWGAHTAGLKAAGDEMISRFAAALNAARAQQGYGGRARGRRRAPVRAIGVAVTTDTGEGGWNDWLVDYWESIRALRQPQAGGGGRITVR